MKEEFSLGYRSLKNLMYDYLRDNIRKGELKPGDTINMEQTAKKLGMSKTPLREALIKLEAEGFVRIVPWRGVVVNKLTVQDFKECYQILGALESSAILSASTRIKKHDVMRMGILNDEMIEAIEVADFDAYCKKNIEFHGIYLDLSNNKLLADTADILKKRLYDFSRPKEFIKEWEDFSLGEHKKLVDFLYQNEFLKAADYLRNTIWNFDVQKKYIVKYYRFEDRNLE